VVIVVLQLLTNVRDVMSVRVYHRQRQPQLPNLCADHQCGQLCLPRQQEMGAGAATDDQLSGELRHAAHEREHFPLADARATYSCRCDDAFVGGANCTRRG